MAEKIQPDTDNGPYLFVSYSHKDTIEVQGILQYLREARCRFWYDEGIGAAVEWAEEIAQKIVDCEQVLLFISPDADASNYVQREVGFAISHSKSLCIVYLYPTQLSPGMEFLLTGINHIKFYDLDKAGFEKKLLESISKKVVKPRYAEYWTHFDEDTPLYYTDDSHTRYRRIRRMDRKAARSVYLAQDIRTKALVVLKEIIARKNLGQNLDALNALSGCPFVPKLVDCYQAFDSTILVTNYIGGHSLNRSAEYSEEEIVSIGLGLLEVLSRLHSLHIIHGDIKPSHIIRNDDGDIFLIDYDVSVHADNSGFAQCIGYSPVYVSDEAYSSRRISYTSDIYSAGMTLKVLLLKKFLSPSEIGRNGCPIRSYRSDISAELEYVIETMIRFNPQDRYQTAREAYNGLRDRKKQPFLKMLALYIRSWWNIARFRAKQKEIAKEEKGFVEYMASQKAGIPVRLSDEWKLPSGKDMTTILSDMDYSEVIETESPIEP